MIALILGALLALMTAAVVYLLLAGRRAVRKMRDYWRNEWVEQGTALALCRRRIATLVAARELDAAALDCVDSMKQPRLVKPIRVRCKSEKKERRAL